MEGSIVAVEENHQRADSSNGGPNSLGSLVKIDSISIDLGITMARKNDMADNCRHFTIRGYVAEMREKDSRLCDPFSLFGKDSTPEEQFPPKCRRWECKKCPRDVNIADSKCCEREIIASSSRIDKSHLGESQALEIYDRRETDLNTSAANSDRNEINILSNYKGKNVEVEDLTTRGHDNGLEDNAAQEIVNRACELQVLNRCQLVNEEHTEIAAPDRSRDSQSIEISEANREIQDAAGVLLAIEYPTCDSAERGQKINSSYKENREICRINEGEKVDKGKRIRLPSFDSDEFDVASDDPSHHYENTTAVGRKRPQKVRLLADLLGNKDNLEKDKRRTASGSFPNEIPNLSNELGLVSANPSELGLICANPLAPERKRKMEEDKQVADCNWLKNFGKKPRTLKGDEDHKKFAIEISDSETEDAAFVVNKSKLKKHGSDRNPNLVQKKNKQVQFVDQYFPIGSWGDVNIPKSIHNKSKETEQIGAGGSFADFDLYKNRGAESHFKNYNPQQHSGKESSSSSKKKNKMPQVEERQSFFMPPSRTNDIRFLQNGSEIAKSTMGLDLSLSGFMNVERNEKNHVAQAVDKNGFYLPRPKAISSKDIRRKEGVFIGEPSVYRKSIPDQFMRERLNYDFNQNITHGGSAMSREQQQNCSPRFEDGSFSMRHNLDLSGPSNGNRPTEAHCRLEPVRRHNEQRNSEEIPMEIVELMAKNQYERSLCEAEKNNYRRNNNNNKRTNPEMIMGFPNKVHGNGNNNNGVMRILPKEYPSMRKPPPTEHVGPSKPNHISFFAPDQRNRFNVEENPGLKMFDAFSQQSIRFQNSYQNNDKPQQFWSFRPPQQVSEDCQIPDKNKGKIVREFDLNRVAPNNNNNSESFNGMMSMAYHAPARELRGPPPPPDRNPKVMSSSFDSFSQDAIPAMQLLSLMDAGLNTSKPFDVYPKRVLEKPFYPCGNHPNFTMDKPLFQGNYSNSKSTFSGVVYKPVESSRHTSSSSLNNYGKNQISEKPPCECAADSHVPLFQTDRNSKRPVSTDNHIFFKPRSNHQNPQNKPRKSHKHGSTILEFKPVHHDNKQKGVVGSSSKRVYLEESNWNGNVGHVNLTSRNEGCALNRNPADFSVPEEDNEYTINGEDLRFPKKNSPKAKSKILRQ